MIKEGDVVRIRRDSSIIPKEYLDSVGIVTKLHKDEVCDYVEVRVQQSDMSHRNLYTIKEDLI